MNQRSSICHQPLRSDSVFSITSRLAVSFGFLSLVFFLGQSACRAQDEKPEKPEEVKKKGDDKKAMQPVRQRTEDEYRIFLRRPDKVHQFWTAIKVEVGVGKFDL